MSEQHSTAVFYAWTGVAQFAIAGAILALIPAFLLAGWQRYAAIAATLVICSVLLTVYRFEVDSSRRMITVRTLWLGLLQRKVVRYTFSDVRDVREEFVGDNGPVCVLEFSSGRRFELPIECSELQRSLKVPAK